MATATTSREESRSIGVASGGRVPDDPAAFVARAEQATNDADESLLDGLYARDAYFENLIDGIHDCYRGEKAVARAWRAYMGGLAARRLQVSKRVIAVSEDTIVNDWRGTIAGERPVYGIEVWRFDEHQRVQQHRLLGSLMARSSMDPRSVPKLGLAPRTNLALLRHLLLRRAFPNAKPSR